MVKENIEIEIKVKVNNPDDFEKRVMELHPEATPEVFERTIRFDTPTGNLEQRGIFVRVRSGKTNTWTVKKKIKNAAENEKFFERNEWETDIADINNARQMLKVLGFEKEFIMEKYRKTYTLPNITITIDRLPFGTYAELEGAKEEIDATAKLLDISLDDRITVTYWDLHDAHNKEHGLTGENIVFNN